MSSRAHHSDYDEATTARCERALVTLLGDLGPWREQIYLAGGWLAPRYLIGQLEKSGFDQSEPSFRWTRDVEGVKVIVEFLCETEQEDFGRIFRP